MTAFENTLFLAVLLTCTLIGADSALAAHAVLAAATTNSGTFVTAESRFRNGSITEPIRRTDKGWEVLLPGGHWVYCRRSCAETLRVETIDFFNANSAGSGQLTNECGIFGCLDLKYAK
jgi:hypothetical protein